MQTIHFGARIGRRRELSGIGARSSCNRKPAVPFKANADHRHRVPKQRHRVTNWPALAEAAIARYQRLIGDELRSCTARHQATEVAIAGGVLDQELGRPQYVRLA